MKVLSLLMLCCEKQCNIQARSIGYTSLISWGRYFAKEVLSKWVMAKVALVLVLCLSLYCPLLCIVSYRITRCWNVGAVIHVIIFFRPPRLLVNWNKKSLWSFARAVRRDHVNRAPNAGHAARTCERFVYSIIKITRLYDYRTWPTYFFDKFTTCAKASGFCSWLLFSVGWFGWLAGRAHSHHLDGTPSHSMSWPLKEVLKEP